MLMSLTAFAGEITRTQVVAFSDHLHDAVEAGVVGADAGTFAFAQAAGEFDHLVHVRCEGVDQAGELIRGDLRRGLIAQTAEQGEAGLGMWWFDRDRQAPGQTGDQAILEAGQFARRG